MIFKSNIIAVMVIFFLVIQSSDDSYKVRREKMVRDQIEARGVNNEATLAAMMKVKRHLFVSKDLRENAYEDRPLPIGYGQTISQPYIVGYMTGLINPKPGDKILEIGTGSGYQAAVLAEIVDTVYTIEIITELAAQAVKRIQEMKFTNIEVKNADGYYGWEEHAPFDAIVVTAAAEYIPPPLIKQLKDGGRMVIPVGSPFLTQNLILVVKEGEKIETKNLLPVRFVPFTRGQE